MWPAKADMAFILENVKDQASADEDAQVPEKRLGRILADIHVQHRRQGIGV